MALNRLKASRGLQPVPEESGVNGTSAWPADTDADDAASSAKFQEGRSRHADHTSRSSTIDCRFPSSSCADGGGSEESLDNVSEKDYRIWFPRAEVADDAAASRGSSDWRTFREYRYTECAQNGRLEKTLSVEKVHKRKNFPMADGQETTVSFQCAPCSTTHEGCGGDQIDGQFSRVLSSTKGQLYREYHTQLLSRLEDDSTPEAQAPKVDPEPKLAIDPVGIGREKEVCQTAPEKFAMARNSVETGLDTLLANEPEASTSMVDSLLKEQDGHSSQLGSAGFHDVTAVSEDDDLDDQKSTYVRADNVDSEVEDVTSEVKETVVGGPSLDDLGYIAEEPEDEIDESASDSEKRKIVSVDDKEQVEKCGEARMACSDVDSRTGAVPSSQSNICDKLSEAGGQMPTLYCSENDEHIQEDTTTCSGSDVRAGLDGESRMCDIKEQTQSSHNQETQKQGICRSEEPNIITEAVAQLHVPLLDTEVEVLSQKRPKRSDHNEEKHESLNITSTENKSTDLKSVNAAADVANEENSAETPVTNLEVHPEPLLGKSVFEVPAKAFGKEAEARSEAVEFNTCNEGIKEDLQRTSENVSVSSLLSTTEDLIHCEKERGHVTNSLKEGDKDENLQTATIEDLDGALYQETEVLEVRPPNDDENQTVKKGQEPEKDVPTSIVITKKDGQETVETAPVTDTDIVSSSYISTDEIDDGVVENKNEAGDAIWQARDLQLNFNNRGESVQGEGSEASQLDPSHADNAEPLARNEESMLGTAICLASNNEATQEAFQTLSAIGVDSLSSKDFSSNVTVEVVNENGELSGNKVGLKQERQHDEAESPEDVSNKRDEMLEPDIPHINKTEPMTESEESVRDAATSNTNVNESIKEELESVSTIVDTSVSKRDVFWDAEAKTVEENDEVPDELEKVRQRSMPKSLESASGEMTEDGTSHLSRAGSVMKIEESMQDSATRLSDVNEDMEETLVGRRGIVGNSLSRTNFSSDAQTKNSEENEELQDIKLTLEQDLQLSMDEVPHYSLPEMGEVLLEKSLQFAKIQSVIDSQEKKENIFTCPTDVKQPVQVKTESISATSKDSPFSKSAFQEETLGTLRDRDEQVNTSVQTEKNCHVENMQENLKSRQAKSIEMLRDDDTSQNHDTQPLNENAEATEEADILMKKSVTLEDNEGSQLSLNRSHAFDETENTTTQDPEPMGSAKLNDQELQTGNVELKALETCPATNIGHLGDSTSVSIEANMLKDVMELTGIEDATSLDISLQEDNDQGLESLPCDQTTKHGDVKKACANDMQEQKVPEKGNDENSGHFDVHLEGSVGQYMSTSGGLHATTKAEDITADIMDHKDYLLVQHAPSTLGTLNDDEMQGASQVSLQSKDVKQNDQETSVGRNDDNVENKRVQSSENERVNSIHLASGETNKSLEVTELTNFSKECTYADQGSTVNGGMELVDGNQADAGCQPENLIEETNSAHEAAGSSENQEFMNQTYTTEDSESGFNENETIKAETAGNHHAHEAIENVTVEADVEVPVRVLEEAYLESDAKEERLKLRAYAEDIVSTVLTKCVTQLEENNQKFISTENTKMNYGDLKAKKLIENLTGERQEIQTVASTKPETQNEDIPCAVLRPIASRQSAFEKVMPLDNLEDNDVKDEMLEEVLTTTADRNMEELNEKLILSKGHASINEPERSDRADADLLISIDENSATNVDELKELLSDVSSTITRETAQSAHAAEAQPEEDVSDKVSVSQVLTEELTSNENESNNSADTIKTNCEVLGQDDELPEREDTAQDVHRKLLPAELPSMTDVNTHNEGAGTAHLTVGIETGNTMCDALTSKKTEIPTTSVILSNDEASPENIFAAQKEHNALPLEVQVPEKRAVDASDKADEVAAPTADVSSKSEVTKTSEKENESTKCEKTTVRVADASEEFDPKDVIHDAVREDDSAKEAASVVGENTKFEQRNLDVVNHSTVEDTNEASSPREYSERRHHDFREGRELEAADDNATVLHLDDSALQDQDSKVLFNVEADKSSSIRNISINNDGTVQEIDEEQAHIIREDLSIADRKTLHDSDKDSLGALSTVYENSLEEVKFNLDEDIAATDATATVSSNKDVVDTIANPERSLHHIVVTAGGIFKEDESNNENDERLDPPESIDSCESSPLQRASNTAAENGRAHEESSEDNDLETGASYRIAADFEVQGYDGVVCGPIDADNALGNVETGGISDNCKTRERATLQTPEDSTLLQEVKDEDIGHGQALNKHLQSKIQPEVNHDCQEANTDKDATREKDINVVEENERNMRAGKHHDEVIVTVDTPADRTEGEITDILEQHEPSATNEHQELQQDNQASDDEVAAIDFSDEEQQSLEQINAQNYEDITDSQNINGDYGSHEVRKRTLEKEDVPNESAFLEPLFVTVSENDDGKDITDYIGAETWGQFGKPQEECSVHGNAKASDHISTLERSLSGSQEKSHFDSRQATIGTLKTAVLVHEATKLETVEWSEDPLNSVATEADFSSDVYEQTADGQNASSISDAQSDEQIADGMLNIPEGKALKSSGDQEEIFQPPDIVQELGGETEELRDDLQEAEGKASSNIVEDAIVPQHIDTGNDKPSSTDSEVESEKGKSTSDEKYGKDRKKANTDLKDAIEKFSTIISSEDAGLHSNRPTSQETVEVLDGPVITEVTDRHVIPEDSEDEAENKGHPSSATNAKLEPDSDDERKSENVKPDFSENIHTGSVDQNSFGHEDTQPLKEDTTHSVRESVEKSERTEREDAASHERFRSTRIFHRTVLRTESTRTVRKTRSFMPYSRDKDPAYTRPGHEVEIGRVAEPHKPLEETYVAREAFEAMSIPRRGLCPVSSAETPCAVCDVGVQTLPSTNEKEVQVEFNEHDCIARLVELQIAMNEQEEVRRQDMKAACELVEKLEAIQLSESLMRSQIRAMDVERREQSAREARLRDELQAWQETVQQQQLLLQQLKEDLDDTEDTLAAQRQEANRLRERMLVLQESCDSGLLMADLLTRADKEVQTPDGAQHPLYASYKGSRADDGSPVYLGQLEQHRRLSALVSSQLEATANRIAQLRREAAANRSMARAGGGLDDYMHDLAVRSGQDAPPT